MQQPPPGASSITAALDTLGFGPFHYLLWTYTGLAWAADAMETMILSYLGPAVACTWPETVTPAAQSWLTSVVFGGMLFGVYTLGTISDSFGRRKGFLMSALMLGGLGLASAAAPSFGWLLVVRGLVGFALGG